MKKLQPVNVARLGHLEFGQHIKSITKALNLLQGDAVITDAVLLNYLSKLDGKSTDYDRAMVQIFKSDETAKITAADIFRDDSLSAMTRFLSVFELSPVDAEGTAYASLTSLFNTYGNVQAMNYEEETNGINNLVTDLGNEHYLPHVQTLGMTSFTSRLATANTAFETLFAGRTQETAVKEVFDVKAMRTAIKEVYTDLVEYVLAMAKAANSSQFNQSLDAINAVRKYYSDLLARRRPSEDDKPESAIKPM